MSTKQASIGQNHVPNTFNVGESNSITMNVDLLQFKMKLIVQVQLMLKKLDQNKYHQFGIILRNIR
ncbi:hypothetical protein Lalb_Chr02g0153861 [Lupinus albus]|uniref:Uncharacterized protein n=1 Tax=Lupinus albus TaxID=3870 RepID=A0A6A4R1A3_LUPAL|nr:hypothetical protein Lalb_Chr02g0153861 [Lupinus albus]